MNPYLELKLKLFQKEISPELYLKTLNLLNKQFQEQKKQIEEQKKPKSVNVKELQKQQERQRKIEEEKAKQFEKRKLKLKKISEWKTYLNDPSLARSKQKETLIKLHTMDNIKRINYLDQLEVIEKFNNEHHYSQSVVMLEGLIVRKQCQQDSFGNHLFWNEVKSLKILSPYPHFPILVAYDPYRLIIYMTYCGEMLSSKNMPQNWKEQFQEIKEIMTTLNVNSNDMLIRNTCCFGGEINVIDFGLNTQFGRGLTEVLKEFYYRVSQLVDGGSRNRRDNEINNKKTELKESFNSELTYPGWKDKLEKHRKKQKQIELFYQQYNEQRRKRKSKK